MILYSSLVGVEKRGGERKENTEGKKESGRERVERRPLTNLSRENLARWRARGWWSGGGFFPSQQQEASKLFSRPSSCSVPLALAVVLPE